MGLSSHSLHCVTLVTMIFPFLHSGGPPSLCRLSILSEVRCAPLNNTLDGNSMDRNTQNQLFILFLLEQEMEKNSSNFQALF